MLMNLRVRIFERVEEGRWKNIERVGEPLKSTPGEEEGEERWTAWAISQGRFIRAG